MVLYEQQYFSGLARDSLCWDNQLVTDKTHFV